MCPGAVWEWESWTRPGCLGEVPHRHVRVRQLRPASCRPRPPTIPWTLSSRLISPPPLPRLRPLSVATERGKEREPIELQSHSIKHTHFRLWYDLGRLVWCRTFLPLHVSIFIIFSALMTRRPIGRIPVTPFPPLRRKGPPLRTRSLPLIRFLTPRPTLECSPARVPSHLYPNLSRPGRLLLRCPPAGPFTPLLLSFRRPALWTSTPTLNPVSCTCPNRARPPQTPRMRRTPTLPPRPSTSNPRLFCPVTTPPTLTLLLTLLLRRGPPVSVSEREDSEWLGNYPQSSNKQPEQNRQRERESADFTLPALKERDLLLIEVDLMTDLHISSSNKYKNKLFISNQTV